MNVIVFDCEQMLGIDNSCKNALLLKPLDKNLNMLNYNSIISNGFIKMRNLYTTKLKKSLKCKDFMKRYPQLPVCSRDKKIVSIEPESYYPESYLVKIV